MNLDLKSKLFPKDEHFEALKVFADAVASYDDSKYYDGKPCLYIVGGAVRNAVIGLPIGDYDVASRLYPADIQNIADMLGIEYIPKGARYGAVELRFPCGLHVEHTTFRSDEYSPDSSHQPTSVRFTDDMTVDAMRRDFTINALYYDILGAKLHDPTKYGMRDIEIRLIRTTTKDARLILKDDGVRILRMVRFCSELGFMPATDTMNAASQNVSLIKNVSPARIRTELDKLMLCEATYPQVRLDCYATAAPRSWKNRCYFGLTMLLNLGALNIIFPEMPSRGIKFSARRSQLPLGEHLIRTCSGMPNELHLKLAGLWHDVGRAYINDPECRDSKRHPAIGAELAAQALERLGYDKTTIRSVRTLIELHMFDFLGRYDDASLRHNFVHFGRYLVEDLCHLRSADDRSDLSRTITPEVNWWRVYNRMVELNTPFSVDELNCTGDDIMRWLGIPASSKIASIRMALLECTAQNPSVNTPEGLERLAKVVYSRM